MTGGPTSASTGSPLGRRSFIPGTPRFVRFISLLCVRHPPCIRSCVLPRVGLSVGDPGREPTASQRGEQRSRFLRTAEHCKAGRLVNHGVSPDCRVELALASPPEGTQSKAPLKESRPRLPKRPEFFCQRHAELSDRHPVVRPPKRTQVPADGFRTSSTSPAACEPTDSLPALPRPLFG